MTLNDSENYLLFLNSVFSKKVSHSENNSEDKLKKINVLLFILKKTLNY